MEVYIRHRIFFYKKGNCHFLFHNLDFFTCNSDFISQNSLAILRQNVQIEILTHNSKKKCQNCEL